VREINFIGVTGYAAPLAHLICYGVPANESILLLALHALATLRIGTSEEFLLIVVAFEFVDSIYHALT